MSLRSFTLIMFFGFLFSVCSVSTCIAQKTETRYYEDSDLFRKTTERKARYVVNQTTGPDAFRSMEVTEKKENRVIRREIYNGAEPVGKWVRFKPYTGPVELDYDFTLVYNNKIDKRADSAQFINFKITPLSPFADNDSLHYVAPKFTTGEPNPMVFVQRHICYPQEAMQNEISGKVVIQFIVDTDGAVKDVSVFNRINVLLDKEAMRLALAMKFGNGPMLNGIKKKMRVFMPISFRLD